MPTIIVSIALIVVGLRSAVRPPVTHDFDGALEQVEQFIASGQIDEAYGRLRGMIEPHLDKASLTQQARFHAVSADLMFVSQEQSELRSESNDRHIVNQYAFAEEMGFALSPLRIERRAIAYLQLGEFDMADSALERLQAIANDESVGGTDAADARIAHGRLFRAIIDTQLQRPNLDADRVLQMLAAYRMNGSLTQTQRRWVAARLAELRLESGNPAAAMDGLLIEMRRLETQQSSADGASFGELYMLLARGYHELGDAQAARQHLQHALELLSASEPARGEALVLLGRIALAEGDAEAAIERFNVVISDFVGTRSHLPGLLGKAECESLLGDHLASQAAFREVAQALRRSTPRRDVTAEIVAARLCDRHDAAVAVGRLERALDYISIAETLFDHERVPAEVLIRKASTNRQIAEDVLAMRGTDSAAGRSEQRDLDIDVDPAVRYEANRRFEAAAADYLRHASAESASPLSEEDWAASLWLAAECFDLGGLHRQAIAAYDKYLGSRPPDDARKAEAMFRMAMAHQALMEYAQAAETYERLLADRARSSFAARCFVPLAQCYVALNRPEDARRVLEDVVSGERLLRPEARDYRDALIELGRLLHDEGEYVRAIERLAEAWQRYPDDARLAELQFLLADSYRREALRISRRLGEDTTIAPTERHRLEDVRAGHLHEAARVFELVSKETGGGSRQRMAASTADLVRRAHLYQADCIFELGRFEQAAELYEAASRVYSSAASSMYALVQIVNCYSALGQRERAAAAHQRALLRLQQLPDSAFASPDALMDRTAWERWLRNSPAGVGPSVTASANTTSG